MFWNTISSMADVATQRTSNLTDRGRFGATDSGSPRNVKKKAPEQDVLSNEHGEVESQIEEEEDG